MWKQIKKFTFITSYNDDFPTELISKKINDIEEFNFDIKLWNLKNLINKYVENQKNTEILLVKETFKKCIFDDMKMRSLFEEGKGYYKSKRDRYNGAIKEVDEKKDYLNNFTFMKK